VLAAAAVSFCFVMWSVSAAAAAAETSDSSQSSFARLPPLKDVSVRDDVKM
jgi:hypothetical protein